MKQDVLGLARHGGGRMSFGQKSHVVQGVGVCCGVSGADVWGRRVCPNWLSPVPSAPSSSLLLSPGGD